MRLVDSHCHIADANFPLEQEAVLVRAHNNGVAKIVTVGTDEVDSLAAVTFAHQHDQVWATVGVHPHEAKRGVGFLTRLNLRDPKIVAVGEIGLDYHYDFSPRDVQIQVLCQQIEVALAANLPIVFHVREAFADFWRIVDDYDIKRAVVHSFSDNLANLTQVLMRGWYVGVNGLVTFTKDATQIEAYKRIPLDKLLLETDTPYMTPNPLRGRPNEPANVKYVAEFMAQLLAVSPAELAELTSRNAESLFGLNS